MGTTGDILIDDMIKRILKMETILVTVEISTEKQALDLVRLFSGTVPDVDIPVLTYGAPKGPEVSESDFQLLTYIKEHLRNA